MNVDTNPITAEVIASLTELLEIPMLKSLNFDLQMNVGSPPTIKFAVEKWVVPEEVNE